MPDKVKKTTPAAAVSAPVKAATTPAPTPAPVPETTESAIPEGAWAIPIPDGAQFGGWPVGVWLMKCSEAPKESLNSKQKIQTEFTFLFVDPAQPDYAEREVKFWVSREPKSWWVMTSTLDAMESLI